MVFKHLVISGGGTIGLKYWGILQKLNETNIWKIENINSMYATSAGSLVCVFLCLKYDWETINKYIIERPWQDIFQLSGKQIVEAYYNKGLYDKKIFESVFKPLLEAKDLSLNITLKEFYEYCKIEINFFTFELNSFKTIQMNYKLNPDLSLITAITMSCAIPGVFMPVCIEDNCYIDGGVMANYPLSFCLEMGYNKEEILGINYNVSNNMSDSYKIINKESSILDFIFGFSVNSPLSFKTIKTIEMRKQMIEEGYVNAEEFIQKLSSFDNKN